jgi:plastocyanin
VTFSGFPLRTQGAVLYGALPHRGGFSYRCTIHVQEGMRGKIVVH